jgi:hypothetical protein
VRRGGGVVLLRGDFVSVDEGENCAGSFIISDLFAPITKSPE